MQIIRNKNIFEFSASLLYISFYIIMNANIISFYYDVDCIKDTEDKRNIFIIDFGSSLAHQSLSKIQNCYYHLVFHGYLKVLKVR